MTYALFWHTFQNIYLKPCKMPTIFNYLMWFCLKTHIFSIWKSVCVYYMYVFSIFKNKNGNSNFSWNAQFQLSIVDDIKYNKSNWICSVRFGGLLIYTWALYCFKARRINICCAYEGCPSIVDLRMKKKPQQQQKQRKNGFWR